MLYLAAVTRLFVKYVSASILRGSRDRARCARGTAIGLPANTPSVLLTLSLFEKIRDKYLNGTP